MTYRDWWIIHQRETESTEKGRRKTARGRIKRVEGGGERKGWGEHRGCNGDKWWRWCKMRKESMMSLL